MSPRRAAPVPLALVACLALGAAPAFAVEKDLESLYELSTEGSSTSLKPGEPGRFVLSIRTKGDAHVSDDAPLKISLGGTNVTWPKPTLTRSDAKPSAAKQDPPPPPTFEVAFQPGTSSGRTVAEANVTFFLCTQDICARQQRAVSVPVTLQPARP